MGVNSVERALRTIVEALLQLADDLNVADGDDLVVELDETRRKNLPERTDELPNVRLKWLDEDVKKLLTMHELGVDRNEMARVLGRTPGAIYDRLYHHEYGILRNPGDEDVA
jgi:hypothetical protein